MGNQSVTRVTDGAFQALSDPTRRAVLDLLRGGGPQSAGRIANAFTVSRPAISKHLRMLRRACLVRETREGRNRIYEVDPTALKAVDEWLGKYRAFWSTSLNNLKEIVEARKS